MNQQRTDSKENTPMDFDQVLLQTLNIQFEVLPEEYWTSENFLRGFENLQLSVTTADRHALRGWNAGEIWDSFFPMIESHCRESRSSAELLSIIMAPANQPELNCQSHRYMIELWTIRYLPNLQILWPEEQASVLRELLAKESTPEFIASVPEGRDGYGSISDRYYHLLLSHGYLPIGNHHDVVAHLILFQNAEINDETRRLAQEFYRALTLMSQLGANGTVDAEVTRRHLRLYGFSWNLLQEKMYERSSNSLLSISMIGAFNSSYNTVFSKNFPTSRCNETAGAMGFFSSQPTGSILLLPHQIRSHIVRDFTELNRSTKITSCLSEVDAKINLYADAWKEVGLALNPDSLNTAELEFQFCEIVRKTLFLEVEGSRVGFEVGWKNFSQEIQQNYFYNKLLQKRSLILFATRMLEVAIAITRLEEAYYADKAKNSLSVVAS